MDFTAPETMYGCDQRYQQMMDYIEQMGSDALYAKLLGAFRTLSPQIRGHLEQYFDQYLFWGSIHDAEGDHSLLRNRAQVLYEHRQDFHWLYQRLQDYRSRLVLFTVLRNWYSFASLQTAKEQQFSQYFDLDLVRCDENEVFIDVGAYIGDTVKSYISNYGADQYKRIYCYEMSPDMQEQLQQSLATYSHLILRPVGLADRGGHLFLRRNADLSANILTAETGMDEARVAVVSLDEDVAERVSFIKMDIEGGEQRALLGCRGHIERDRPKLAISVYHGNEDIWKIARMIDSFSEGYSFYLRYYGGSIFPTELVLYALPRA